MTLLQRAAPVPASGTWADAGVGMPRTFLLCRAAGRACAFASGAVLEVMPATPPAPLPGVASPVLGMVCVRGAVVPVFDLAAALGALVGASAGPRGTRRLRPACLVHVLLRDGARLAVAAVDEVGELFERRHYAFPVRSGDDDLLRRLDIAIVSLREDGALDHVRTRWFGH